MKEIEELIEISRKYGSDSRYVIAGGGNTSYKTADRLWVKASGYSLATITEEGLAVLDRQRLSVVSDKQYGTDSSAREEEVKNDLAFACLTKDRRPSVETSLHNTLDATYVVHLHPTMVNALMCSAGAEEKCHELFGDTVLYVPYTDPGYVLFKEVENRVNEYRNRFGSEPEVIMLQNHGIFVAADSTSRIEMLYKNVLSKIESRIGCEMPSDELQDVEMMADEVVPALRMMLSRDGKLRTLRVIDSRLIEYFAESEERFGRISRPFTPDGIVYCKSKYVYASATDAASLRDELEKRIEIFVAQTGYAPKIFVIKGMGLVVAGYSAAECKTLIEVFTDAMKIAFIASTFGGEHPMTETQTNFIDNWEVENYRRKVSSAAGQRRMENKVFIVTGAAQGFGKGIVMCLMPQGANIVVADMNEVTGIKTTEILNGMASKNMAVFVKTNVADMDSLRNLIHRTVCDFGGVDVFVSNAGVLRAGGLDEMTPENFEFVTRINYIAYFYCSKVVSHLMKLQNAYNKDNWGDIVQINSKSGLRGSKANFAYAGGKFGGIGLTQSFALELAPFRVKVNSICPGNYYDGPLWSDPEKGLFLQYLHAGKVPGAKTVEDVKEYYMAQVPMRKGCSPEDVTKALLYLVEQICETGQALPVTGGQVMLS